MLRSVAAALWCSLCLAACGPSGGSTSEDDAGVTGSTLVCTVTPPTSCPSPAPRFIQDVQTIFVQRCQACHDDPPTGQQWPLIDYQDIVDWQDTVRADLSDCSMPPPDAGTGMTDDERLRVLQWIRCGAPR
jgi:uncharacterized membrane protein